MFFNHNQFERGSLSAQKAFFSYCEAYLKKSVPFYTGPISPYQYRRYIPWNQDQEDNNRYEVAPEFNEPLEELYFQGFFLYQVINCSFKEFKNALFFGNHLHKNTSYYYGFRREEKKPSKYLKQPHHRPKEIDDKSQAKIDWRERKGFERDYRRKSRSFRGKCKKIRKFFDNKKHRQWERENLFKEKFDELTDFKNKKIFDPWKID